MLFIIYSLIQLISIECPFGTVPHTEDEKERVHVSMGLASPCGRSWEGGEPRCPSSLGLLLPLDRGLQAPGSLSNRLKPDSWGEAWRTCILFSELLGWESGLRTWLRAGALGVRRLGFGSAFLALRRPTSSPAHQHPQGTHLTGPGGVYVSS